MDDEDKTRGVAEYARANIGSSTSAPSKPRPKAKYESTGYLERRVEAAKRKRLAEKRKQIDEDGN